MATESHSNIEFYKRRLDDFGSFVRRKVRGSGTVITEMPSRLLRIYSAVALFVATMAGILGGTVFLYLSFIIWVISLEVWFCITAEKVRVRKD